MDKNDARTVHEYFKQYETVLDPEAFREAAETFFGTGNFWDLPVGPNEAAAIETIASGPKLVIDIKTGTPAMGFDEIDRMCEACVREQRVRTSASGRPFPSDPEVRRSIASALGAYVRVALNRNFVAYMEMHFAITFDDGSVTWTKYDCDFRNTVTEQTMLDLRDAVASFAEQTFQKHVENIKFIDRTRYETALAENPGMKTVIFRAGRRRRTGTCERLAGRMRIDVDKTMADLETRFSMDGQAARITRSLLEYVDAYYDSGKPHRMLLKILAPIGFTEETLEDLMACGAITFD